MGDYKFVGWVGHDSKAVDGNMVWEEFKPKAWSEDDVDIQVTHSGICGTDVHTLRSGWGATPYPIVVGHEIVGKVVRAGKNVSDTKVGDVVGVGAQSDADMDCEQCQHGDENMCSNMVATYGGKYPNGDIAMGGHATYARVPGRFAIKLPSGLDHAIAAPLMCGGVTIYNPLKENGCGPGKTVGIIGLGGIGHYGIMFAKALGADKVIGFSRKANKRDDALKLGADEYVATAEDKDWAKKCSRTCDLIVSTISGADMPLQSYLGMLKPRGQFIQVGVPEDLVPQFHAFDLIVKGCKIGGSPIGSRETIKEMLQLAVDKKLKPWVQERPMEDGNQAMADMVEGKARYRYVLVNKV